MVSSVRESPMARGKARGCMGHSTGAHHDEQMKPNPIARMPDISALDGITHPTVQRFDITARQQQAGRRGVATGKSEVEAYPQFDPEVGWCDQGNDENGEQDSARSVRAAPFSQLEGINLLRFAMIALLSGEGAQDGQDAKVPGTERASAGGRAHDPIRRRSIELAGGHPKPGSEATLPRSWACPARSQNVGS